MKSIKIDEFLRENRSHVQADREVNPERAKDVELFLNEVDKRLTSSGSENAQLFRMHNHKGSGFLHAAKHMDASGIFISIH